MDEAESCQGGKKIKAERIFHFHFQTKFCASCRHKGSQQEKHSSRLKKRQAVLYNYIIMTDILN